MLKKIFNADAVFGYIMIAVSIAFYVMSEMSFGTNTVDGGIGEGYLPKILSVIIILFALFIIVDSIVKDRHYFALDEEQKKNVKTMFIILALFLIYIAVWNYVHFIPQTFILLAGMSFVLKMSKKFTLIFSLVFSVGIYFLFSNVFHILL